MKERDAFLLLNGLQKIGPVTSKKLLQHYDGQILRLFNASRKDLKKIIGIGDKIIDSLKNTDNSNWLTKELERINRREISFLPLKELPYYLQQIYDPPIGLYVDGNIPKLPFVSIVGSRNPTMYGQKLAKSIAAQLTYAGFCVVSGLARGIDTAAHEGALEAGGPTVAVLGSGIDIIYPPENIGLYQNIIKNGAVVSEFKLGRKADRKTFPMRNRIVSGISLGVLVVESAATGGSLITAQFAADQGRTVFAIPGRVDQPSSDGCHKIIREGATLVRSAKDIIEELRPYINERQSTFNDFNKIVVEDRCTNQNLNKNESLILNHLKEGNQFTLDELSSATTLSVSEIMSALTLLELNNFVRKNANGKFEHI